MESGLTAGELVIPRWDGYDALQGHLKWPYRSEHTVEPLEMLHTIGLNHRRSVGSMADDDDDA